MTKVISAFPGTGKSYFTASHELEGDVLDLDSSSFSWLYTDEGKIRHPDFPKNYMDHIKSHVGSAAVILVSSHADVRNALVDEGIDFTLVFPRRNLKEEYLERFKRRESPQDFIDLIDKNWDIFLEQLEYQEGCSQVVLGEGQYLSDIL